MFDTIKRKMHQRRQRRRDQHNLRILQSGLDDRLLKDIGYYRDFGSDADPRWRSLQ
ncbi:DUF1127 domain-containing protein [Sedimentitalea todarodis]|uniref:DUF1127 domain-containing protein n=1 Tax=Sedimentitalea todarodis TaxID=1631240 RepID=A0ABU3VLM5_9RHOB|nr:DUF1127 domain-containing protein [Sedimentitalea todarodis]MDU9007101.1 DUF1127 domain-containing protein [Sedimentitalea todarodis]